MTPRIYQSLQEVQEENLTRRQIQAIDTRNNIYAAAVKVINKKGFENVSIEDITTEAGVAKGSFYTHFTSKADILFYNAAEADRFYLRAIKQCFYKPFCEAVIAFISLSYAEHEKRGKGIIKAIISNYYTFPDYNVFDKRRALIQCLSDLVEKGKEEGVLSLEKKTDDYVDALIATLVGGEVLWCFDQTGRQLVKIMEELFRVTVKGMIEEVKG